VPEAAVPQVSDVGAALPSLIGSVHGQLPVVVREIAQQELRYEVMLLRPGHGSSNDARLAELSGQQQHREPGCRRITVLWDVAAGGG
jgi:hypothetical protein